MQPAQHVQALAATTSAVSLRAPHTCARLLLAWSASAHPSDYWGWFKPQRSYHHTGVVSTFYAMREALAIVGEEGLPAMWDRHLAAHQLLWKGLAELGLEPYVLDPKDRCVRLPHGC